MAGSNIAAFMRQAEQRWSVSLPDYEALWRWSVDCPEQFWPLVWDFCGIVAETRGERVIADGDTMPGARFFPDARLSFAQNLMRRRDDTPALIFKGEDRVKRMVTWAELYDEVSCMAQAMRAMGIVEGDRVAAYMPNMPETVIAMLAANSIGAIFSSASPDFGVQGVVDRFGQIEPRLLLLADGYYYGGKTIFCLDKLPEILSRMPSVEKAVVVPYIDATMLPIAQAVHLEMFLAPFKPCKIAFAQIPFNHPLYIMFSSGTTGVPKCIVHGQGGTLLQQLKEHRLNGDMRAGDRALLFGTGFGGTAGGFIVASPVALSELPIVEIDGRAVIVEYAGYVSSGLVQINMLIPAGFTGAGDFTLRVTWGNPAFTVQQGVRIPVRENL